MSKGTDFHGAAFLQKILHATLLPRRDGWQPVGEPASLPSSEARCFISHRNHHALSLFKIIGTADKSALFTRQPLPENRRSFGNKPGLSRTNPSKPCVGLFLSSVHAYLKVAGNCTCVHAAICSGTYGMRGPVLNLFYLSQDLGTQKWCPNRGTSVHGQCYRKLRVLPCFLLSGSWSPPGSKNVLVLRCWQERPSFHF